MPELPEVETMARDLAPLLLGRQISASWLALDVIAGPSRAGLLALSGQRVRSVGRRAKTVLLELDDQTVIGLAPRMTGHFRLCPADAPHARHEHFGLRFSDGGELRWVDPRRFGRLGYWQRQDGHLLDSEGADPFAQIGPEPLVLGPGTLARHLERRSGHKRSSLKAFLLDQSNLAGIGNIYADETLFAARLAPARAVNTVLPLEWDVLATQIVRLLSAGIEARGARVENFDSPGGDARMQDQLAVYGRAGLACTRCGHILQLSRLAGRSTVACSRCQL